jgi:hypothetical protein
MKQNSLQYLLDKFREGTLTDEERSELNRLTHRDEVMASAHSRARGILWRRASLAVGAVAVIGAGVLAVVPRPTEEVMVAEVREVPAAVQVAPAVEQVLRPVEAREAVPTPVAMAKPEPKVAPTSRPANVRPATIKKSEPVVVCNNQCDADSVINDIKRFLSV